ARMARCVAGAREHYGTGNVAHASDHFGIDEIGEAPEKQSEGRGGRRDVAQRERVDALGTREEVDGGHHAEQSAVERHTAIPHRGDLDRVCPEIAWLVEQHETQTGAAHKTTPY